MLVLAVAALGCGDKKDTKTDEKKQTKKVEKAEEGKKAPEEAVKKAPAEEPVKEVPVEEPKKEEPVKEEPVKEEAPVKEPVKEEAPVEEPVKVEPPVEVKPAALDLAKAYAEVPVTIMAPAGATAAESFGVVEVRKGDGFQLQVSTEESNGLAALKKEHEANTMNKLKRFVVDTPEAIFYESEVMGRSEFHFAAYVKLAEDKFVYCEDNKGPTYTEEQVKAMLDACLTAKPNS
jgi:hypothetical protein